MNERDGHAALTNAGGDAFYRPCANVAHGKNTGNGCFQ
jgi:hypothetical protein